MQRAQDASQRPLTIDHAVARGTSHLFEQVVQQAIVERARVLLDAATGTRDVALRTAFIQGSSKSRGMFTDLLDAVTVLLHERTQSAVLEGHAARAAAHARAIRVVEEAKQIAHGNVNPQLISAQLLTQLREILA